MAVCMAAAWLKFRPLVIGSLLAEHRLIVLQEYCQLGKERKNFLREREKEGKEAEDGRGLCGVRW